MSQSAAPRAAVKHRQIRLWVWMLTIVVAAGLAYYFLVSKPAGTGPTAPKVPLAPFEQVWSDRPVLLLGLGDSVTDGFGASPGLSYFERLERNPPNEHEDMKGRCLQKIFPNLSVRNLSVSGSTSKQHLKGQIEPLEVHPPDVFGIVVLTTGGNDLIHNYGRTAPLPDAMYGATLKQATPWLEAFAARLDRMLTTIHSKFPGGCHIFLANVYDPTDGMGDPESVRLPAWEDSTKVVEACNKAIKDGAARHPFVSLVDIHTPFLGHGIHCTQPWTRHYRAIDPHFWYDMNLEDPNDRGYDAIRRMFLQTVVAEREKLMTELQQMSGGV